MVNILVDDVLTSVSEDIPHFAFYGDLSHDNASSIHYQGMPPNRPLRAALAWFPVPLAVLWQVVASSVTDAASAPDDLQVP